MIYQTYVPPAPLSQFIEFFWIKSADRLTPVQTRLLPMGTMELVINLYQDQFPLFDRQSRLQRGSVGGTMLCGVHSENFIIRDDCELCVMGVHFRPAGGAAFFDLPASELYNEIVSLDEIWKTQAAELRDRLLQAASTEDRFQVLEAFLGQRLRPAHGYPAVNFALQQFQQLEIPSVSAIVDQTGFSARYFNQLFRDQVGLTPKLFCRIQRLQHVLALLLKTPPVDWIDIAATCGYYDQAHFIHDFRQFTNCTPTEYLAKRGFHPCHLLLAE